MLSRLLHRVKATHSLKSVISAGAQTLLLLDRAWMAVLAYSAGWSFSVCLGDLGMRP